MYFQYFKVLALHYEGWCCSAAMCLCDCCPLHRLANKQDKPEALDEVDICELLNLESVVNSNKCPCRIVSHIEDTTYTKTETQH